MRDDFLVEKVQETPSLKRRKLWDLARAAAVPLPMPSAHEVKEALILQVAQPIIEESNNKVIKTTLDKSRFNKEDHERESKLLHLKRFHLSAERKYKGR